MLAATSWVVPCEWGKFILLLWSSGQTPDFLPYPAQRHYTAPWPPCWATITCPNMSTQCALVWVSGYIHNPIVEGEGKATSGVWVTGLLVAVFWETAKNNDFHKGLPTPPHPPTDACFLSLPFPFVLPITKLFIRKLGLLGLFGGLFKLSFNKSPSYAG